MCRNVFNFGCAPGRGQTLSLVNCQFMYESQHSRSNYPAFDSCFDSWRESLLTNTQPDTKDLAWPCYLLSLFHGGKNNQEQRIPIATVIALHLSFNNYCDKSQVIIPPPWKAAGTQKSKSDLLPVLSPFKHVAPTRTLQRLPRDLVLAHQAPGYNF